MKRIALTLIFLLIGWMSKAQVWSGGGHFNSGFAQGKLAEETPGLHLPTLSGFLIYEAPTLPLSVGLEFGYGVYGSKLERRTDLYEGFSDELRLRRNNNLASGMILLRYQTNPMGKIRHFFEAKFGTHYLYTRYKIRESILSEEVIESGKDLSSWTLGYGLGTGIQIPIQAETGLFLELKAAYQTSNGLRFLTKGDASFNPLPGGGGTFDYQIRRAPLELMTFSVGVIYVGVFE